MVVTYIKHEDDEPPVAEEAAVETTVEEPSSKRQRTSPLLEAAAGFPESENESDNESENKETINNGPVKIEPFQADDSDEPLPQGTTTEAAAQLPLNEGTKEMVMDEDVEILHCMLNQKAELDVITPMVEERAKESNMSMDDAWIAMLSAPDEFGQLALHVAIQEHAPSDVIVKLIEKYPGAVTVKRDADKLTPLHIAAYRGCTLPVLTALLKEAAGSILVQTKGADDRNTPLHLVFHPDTKSLWEKPEPDFVPMDDVARYIIKTHAMHFKRLNKKVKGETPVQRAKKLLKTKNRIDDLNDKGKKTGRQWGLTVIEQANKLFPDLCPKKLKDLMYEMAHIGAAYDCKLQSWPELDLYKN